MDQTVSLMARAGRALFLDRSGLVGRGGLCLACSGRTGRVGNRARSLPGVLASALRDADLSMLPMLDDVTLEKRTRHAVTENERVLGTVELLRSGRVVEIGPLLTESHRSLRDDFEVSSAELNTAVDAALAAGAAGARMTGGGFGGSAIALVPEGAAGVSAGPWRRLPIRRVIEFRGFGPRRR